MDIQVRGCPTTLSVEASMIILKISVPVKDEAEALKKLKEWGFVRETKANVGKPKEALVV